MSFAALRKSSAECAFATEPKRMRGRGVKTWWETGGVRWDGIGAHKQTSTEMGTTNRARPYALAKAGGKEQLGKDDAGRPDVHRVVVALGPRPSFEVENFLRHVSRGAHLRHRRVVWRPPRKGEWKRKVRESKEISAGASPPKDCPLINAFVSSFTTGRGLPGSKTLAQSKSIRMAVRVLRQKMTLGGFTSR